MLWQPRVVSYFLGPGKTAAEMLNRHVGSEPVPLREAFKLPLLAPGSVGQITLAQVPVGDLKTGCFYASLGIGLRWRRGDDHLVARLPVGWSRAGIAVGG